MPDHRHNRPELFVTDTSGVSPVQRSTMVGGILTSRCTRVELATAMAVDCRLNRTGGLKAPRLVFSSNGSVIARFHSDPLFRQVLDQADILDADGMPLVLATRLLCRDPLPERVATTDFIHDACAVAVRDNLRFFFLGGKHAVAERAAANLIGQHPGLSIVGVKHGYIDPSEFDALWAEIVALKTDVLWLGLGSPGQEMLAIAARPHLKGVAWIRTCGGLFDHKAGDVPRAPAFMQTAGLEWLYRLAREPRRLGFRYLTTNPAAAFHLATKTRG